MKRIWHLGAQLTAAWLVAVPVDAQDQDAALVSANVFYASATGS